MLTVRGISFSVGNKQLISDISFELKPGEFLAILGANGAGKTTLINCLAGLYKPTNGEVLVNQRDLSSMSCIEIAQQMALVPQQQETAFAFTALEMVVMGKTPFLSTFDSPSNEDIFEAEKVMKVLDIERLAHNDYNRLSGGERQLVLLARALFQSQDLLLLDEPTNHLDFRHRYQILSHVKRSCIEANTAVIAILHDPNLAQIYADKVLLMENGAVLDYGDKQQVMNSQNISRLYGIPTLKYQVAEQDIFMPQNILGTCKNRVLIITGESTSGKTTALTQFVASCRQTNVSVKGILCPGEMRDGQRYSSDIQNIQTNERCLFGHKTDVFDAKTATRFQFTEAGMSLGKNALDNSQLEKGDICVVDEIGPMELKGKGFGPLIAPLLAVPNTIHIWIIRPNLVAQACRHWSLQEPLVIDVHDNQLQQKLTDFISS